MPSRRVDFWRFWYASVIALWACDFLPGVTGMIWLSLGMVSPVVAVRRLTGPATCRFSSSEAIDQPGAWADRILIGHLLQCPGSPPSFGSHPPMTRLLALPLLVLPASALLAEDWPAWRGPRGDGTSLDKKAPLVFSPEKNVLWKVAIPGKGHSSPIVSGERVFVTTCLEDKGDRPERVLICLDRAKGREQWRRTVLRAKLEAKHGLN